MSVVSCSYGCLATCAAFSAQHRRPLAIKRSEASTQPHLRLEHTCLSHRRALCKARQAVRVAAATVQELGPLKQQLLDSVEAGVMGAALSEETISILDQLQEAATTASNIKITDEALKGRFKTVFNSTNFVDAEGCTTLGTLTFQQFGPQDAKVKLGDVTLWQGVEGPKQYATKAEFTIVDGPHAGLEGVQTALGEFDLDPQQPQRQNVRFTGIKIEPRHSDETSLSKWLDAMKAANANMGDDGHALIEFPKHMPAFRDFLLLDEDLHVTVGNRKSYVGVAPL